MRLPNVVKRSRRRQRVNNKCINHIVLQSGSTITLKLLFARFLTEVRMENIDSVISGMSKLANEIFDKFEAWRSF